METGLLIRHGTNIRELIFILTVLILVISCMTLPLLKENHGHLCTLECNGDIANISTHQHYSSQTIEEVINITAPPGRRIKVDFRRDEDNLRVFLNEPGLNRNAIGDIWKNSGTFLSLGNRLHLRFSHTESLSITASCYNGTCGRTYYMTVEPIFVQSENYLLNYGNFWSCVNLFISLVGEIIQIRIIHLDLEDGYDFLKMGSGNNNSDPESQITSLTGKKDNMTLVINCSSIWLWFESDASGTATGFQLEVSAVLTSNHNDESVTPEIDISSVYSSQPSSYVSQTPVPTSLESQTNSNASDRTPPAPRRTRVTTTVILVSCISTLLTVFIMACAVCLRTRRKRPKPSLDNGPVNGHNDEGGRMNEERIRSAESPCGATGLASTVTSSSDDSDVVQLISFAQSLGSIHGITNKDRRLKIIDEQTHFLSSQSLKLLPNSIVFSLPLDNLKNADIAKLHSLKGSAADRSRDNSVVAEDLQNSHVKRPLPQRPFSNMVPEEETTPVAGIYSFEHFQTLGLNNETVPNMTNPFSLQSLEHGEEPDLLAFIPHNSGTNSELRIPVFETNRGAPSISECNANTTPVSEHLYVDPHSTHSIVPGNPHPIITPSQVPLYYSLEDEVSVSSRTLSMNSTFGARKDTSQDDMIDNPLYISTIK